MIDWDPVATRADLAAASDRVVIGTLTDVVEGYVFGESRPRPLAADESHRAEWCYPE